MRKILTILAVFAIGAIITACGGTDLPSSSVVVEEPKDYTEILLSARNEKENDAFEIMGRDNEGKIVLTHNPRNIEGEVNTDMTFEVMGLDAEDMQYFALSASMVNIRAYAIAIIKPTEGKTEIIKEGLSKYIETQQKNFEQYLVDQYDIALTAKLEVMESGEIVLVMCSDSDTVFEAIKKSLE